MDERYPCATLERGGIFSDKTLYNKSRTLLRRTNLCPEECSDQWESVQSPKSLTLRLMGTEDLRDYNIQMHFCNKVYNHSHLICEKRSVAYDFIVINARLILNKVYCRCIGVTEPIGFKYRTSVVKKKQRLSLRMMQMTCQPHDECERSAVCYEERIDPGETEIVTGRPKCVCPKKQFCPIYYIQHFREEVLLGKKLIGYNIRCKDRQF